MCLKNKSIFLDTFLDTFYEKKTYNYSIKNSTFKIKNTNLKGNNYTVGLNGRHVVVDASIKCATANNTKNPCKIRLYDGFYNSTKCVIFIKKSTLDTF